MPLHVVILYITLHYSYSIKSKVGLVGLLECIALVSAMEYSAMWNFGFSAFGGIGQIC